MILNFFTEIMEENADKPIRDYRKIAIKYMEGWFFVDLLSIFPFHVFLEKGVMTKLFRLFRMPRLMKLLDVSKFRNILRSFAEGNIDHNFIIK